ncbi:hypothetical protein BH11BAC1_BH11BAC1_22650 [soil metagenome]
MKQNLYLLICWLILLKAPHASAQQNFIKYYSSFLSSALLASNGNILLTSGIQFNNGANQYVVCNDTAGNNLWTNKIQTNRSNCEMVETQNHDFIVATGWDNPATGKLCPGIFKIDSAGNFLWAKIFICDTTDIYALQVVRTSDNYNVLIATEIVQHMLKAIVKFDDNGAILWSKSGDLLPQSTNFVVPVESGALLLMNIRDMAPGNILKLNASGNLVWSYTYTFASAGTMMTGDAQLLPNGNYMLCTNPFPNQDSTEMITLEINSQGSIISSHAFKFEGYWFPHKLNFSTSPSGDLLFNLSNPNSSVAILKTDGNSNLLWMDKVNITTGFGSADIEFIDNSHFITLDDIGFGNFLTIQSDGRLSNNFSCFEPFDSVLISPEPATQVSNSYTVSGLFCTELNYNPVYTPIQPTSVNYCSLVKINDLAEDFSLWVFPNPANNYLFISNPKAAINSISIYNPLGEKVLFNKSQEIYQPQIELNISILLPGVYFLLATTHEGIQTVKFVKD